MDFNLTTLTDEDLDALRVKSLMEQERRDNLAQIPAAIQELSAKYIEGGGDREELIKVVNEHE